METGPKTRRQVRLIQVGISSNSSSGRPRVLAVCPAQQAQLACLMHMVMTEWTRDSKYSLSARQGVSIDKMLVWRCGPNGGPVGMVTAAPAINAIYGGSPRPSVVSCRRGGGLIRLFDFHQSIEQSNCAKASPQNQFIGSGHPHGAVR